MKRWRVAPLENSLSLQIWHFLVRYHGSRHIMTEWYCRSVFIAVPGHIQLPHQPVGSEQGARRSLRSDQREGCHSLQFLVSFYLGESQSLSQLSVTSYILSRPSPQSWPSEGTSRGRRPT